MRTQLLQVEVRTNLLLLLRFPLIVVPSIRWSKADSVAGEGEISRVWVVGTAQISSPRTPKDCFLARPAIGDQRLCKIGCVQFGWCLRLVKSPVNTQLKPSKPTIYCYSSTPQRAPQMSPTKTFPEPWNWHRSIGSFLSQLTPWSWLRLPLGRESGTHPNWRVLGSKCNKSSFGCQKTCPTASRLSLEIWKKR